MLNPLGIINDGYMELTFMRGYQTFPSSMRLFNGAKSGGLQFYDNDFTCYRCKKVKLENMKVDENGKKVQQDINIDGEDLEFHNFAKYEVLPSELEVIVDLEYIINKTYISKEEDEL